MSHRTQITLNDEQYARLRAESEQTGVGVAELVRRAVDTSYRTVSREERLAAIEAGFGAWGDEVHDEDGAAYVERIRPGMAKRLADANG
jgi:hypothetical protein